MANSRKKISELPALNVASLDTTFVLGISGSTTYKISINNLTSSLDTTFATDLVTATLSSSLDGKLSTSSFNSYTASAINGTISGSSQLTSSFDTRYVVSGSITQTTWDNIANKPSGIVSQSTDLSSLNTFTASISTASLVNRLNAIESVSGSWITESETGSFLTSLSGAISSSTQISDLGFVTGSYTTINSFNSLTQSFNSISQSFNVISGSVVSIQGGFDTGSYQTFTTSVNTSISNLNTFTASVSTASLVTSISNLNTFTASQSTSSLVNRLTAIESVSGSWITESETGSFLTSLSGAISSSAQITTFGFVSGSYETTGRGIISSSANLVTTSSFNSYTASISTASLVTSISNLNSVTSSYLTSLSGAISSSSQLTSSFDTRYVASGSISATPSGTISGSAQLTSSFDLRYLVTGSVTSSINALNTFTASQSTASLVTSITNLNTYTSSMNTWTSSLSAIGTLNVDFINAGRITSDQTSMGVGSDIIFNAWVYKNGVSLNTSTGVFTLTAGKTYKLFAELSFANFSDLANGYVIYDWVDATTNTRLDTSGISAGVGEHINRNTNEFNATSTTLIYTPSTNQTIKVRIVEGAGTVTVRQAIGTKAIIEQINPSVALNQFETLQVSGSLVVSGSTTLRGITRFETVGGDEGGEFQIGIPTTNTTLQNRVTVDVWQNRLRIFEGSANANGVFIDLSKPTTGNNNEITYKTSGYVNAGTFVTLDNIKAAFTTSGQRGLGLASVSGSFTAFITGTYTLYTGGVNGVGGNTTITTTLSTSLFGWSFPSQGDLATYIVNDTTNSRVYRITLMVGGGYNSNLITIERLH